jgi:hypothetical protein
MLGGSLILLITVGSRYYYKTIGIKESHLFRLFQTPASEWSSSMERTGGSWGDYLAFFLKHWEPLIIFQTQVFFLFFFWTTAGGYGTLRTIVVPSRGFDGVFNNHPTSGWPPTPNIHSFIHSSIHSFIHWLRLGGANVDEGTIFKVSV